MCVIKNVKKFSNLFKHTFKSIFLASIFIFGLTSLGISPVNANPDELTITSLSAPLDPVQVGLSINVSAEFTHPDAPGDHYAFWDWGDNRTSDGNIQGVEGGGAVSGDHVYLVPGVYTVTLSIFDDNGNMAESVFEYVVVFEPSAGFVTGGGWILSPEGAYAPDPSLTGKATFGFVSKFKKGSNIPEGNTEFQFHTADLNFKSTSYQWLVVAGRKAQFKGDGTINGAGDYGFMLTAIDGDLLNGDGIDRFRIKIWDKISDTIVYDNQIDSPDDADPAMALGGGSIVIHRKIKTSDVSIGLVTDLGGVDDHAFNWLSYQGMLRAQEELGVQINLYEPAGPEDLEPVLQQCVDDGNQLCIGAGFLLMDAIMNAANNNPDTAFALLDIAWDQYPDNLRGITFAVDEVGYLAGVLAGRMTTSNVIGTFGGLPIPPVEDYMFGFRNGAVCANPYVEVLMDYSWDFGNPELGATIAQNMMDQGADVIFPVAGMTGTGALLATTQFGNWAIGVDTDQYLSVFENGSVAGSEFLLSSAMKNLDNAIYMTITDYLLGIFSPGTFQYSLALDGVGLAPFHEADPSIPFEVKDELIAIQQGIIDGTIDIHEPCAPPTAVGLITDTAGIGDMGWNWLSYQGLLRAQDELGVGINLYEPASEAELEPAVQQCADDGNQLCIGVGFLLTDAIWNASNNNPDTKFAILDITWEQYPDNLRGILFSADEAGYLAGALAGRMTTSNVVGTFGGWPIPPVDKFLYGYRNGAQCVNPEVEVLMDYTYDWVNQAVGAQIAEGMMSQGADVIFPAAGGAGTGGLLAAAQAGNWAVGVDTDQYLSVFDNGNEAGSGFMLTSAMKNLDNAVFMTIADVLDENFTPGTYHFGLSEAGVGLAPFHEADSSIPSWVKDELAAIQQGIIDGSIDIYDDCKPIGSPAHPIKLFFTPTVDPQVIYDGGSVMVNYLSDVTGLSFEIIVPPSPVDTIGEMCASPDDSMGFIPGIGYVFANEMCGVDPAFKAIRFGWDVYWSEILVPRDSPIDSIDDLAGLTWAIPSYDSFSGYLAPLAMWSSAGITPGDIFDYGGHSQAVMAVYNGEVDFATAYFSPPIKPDPLPPWQPGDPPDIPDELVGSCALDAEDHLVCSGWRVLDARASVRFEAPDVVQNLRILDISDPIANDGLAFGPGFPTELRAQIEAAMLAFAGSPAWLNSIGSPEFYSWEGISPAVDADYDSTRDIIAVAGITLENWGQPPSDDTPTFAARPEEDFIDGWMWPEELDVDLFINDVYISSTTPYYPDWDPWAPYVEFHLDGIDLVPGDVVRLENETTQKVHTVTNLAITEVDPVADTVSGTAVPESMVVVWMHEPDSPWREIFADEFGNWTADFAGEYDIQPGTCGAATQPDDDWDETWIDWCVFNPTLTAAPLENYVDGRDWPDGAEIFLTIDDHDPGTENYTASDFAIYPDWDPWSTWVYFELGEFDLLPGHTVTLSDTVTTKIHDVTGLTVVGIDPDADTIWGTSDTDSQIQLWVHDVEGDVWVSPDEFGNWEADLSEFHDLQPGSCGTAAQYDEDWDQTKAEWCVPDPKFTIQPYHQWATAHGWPASTIVTIDIYEPGGIVPFYTEDQLTGPWGEAHFELYNSPIPGLDMAPGWHIEMTDGVTTKEHVILDVTFEFVDEAADTAGGTGPAGFYASINVSSDVDGHGIVTMIDSEGNWFADFGAEGYDIHDVTDANVEVWDEDGDGTMVHLDLPEGPPTLHVVPEEQQIHGHNWAWDAFVTITVDGYTASKYVYDDPSCGDPCFYLEGIFPIAPGQIVTMTDGETTRTVTVTSLMVTDVDPASDRVYGTADAGSEVWVEIYSEGGVSRRVDADSGGMWMADFSVPGDEDFEQNSYDIMPGTDGRAIQFENVGEDDGTLAWWGVPPPDDQTWSVAVGDLNDDGFLDLVYGNDHQTNSVWFNDGSGGFNDSSQELDFRDSREVKLGDFDGDGDLDIFTANQFGQTNTVWFNDGAGIFTDSGQMLGFEDSVDMALGDLDGDGDLDAFVVNSEGNPDEVWLGELDGIFAKTPQSIGSSSSEGVALGDVDGDGDLDAFVTNYHNEPNQVWLNDGSGTFTDSGQLLGDQDSGVVKLADLDGDGDLDAVVGNIGPNRVYINQGVASGIFIDSGQEIGGEECTWALDVGDLDGINGPDIFIGSADGPNQVWFNDGSGTFTNSGQELGFDSTWAVSLADLDNDGNLDAAIGNHGPNQIWFNNGTGVFE